MCFSHWTVAPGITAILCPGVLPGPGSIGGYGRTICYLVEGGAHALLLDTGFGNADIAAYVAALTNLPLLVANSHVHPDHSGGNAQFPTVLVGANEVEGTAPILFPDEAFPEPRCAAVLSATGYRFSPVADGDRIDLGGRTLEVIEVPGHSRGSIALLDSQTHMLLSGDVLLKRVLLFGDVPIRIYRAALERLQTYEIADILCAHWPKPLGRAHIGRMLRLLGAFDPEQVERAPWQRFGTMCVFRRGESFDDPDFCAIGYPENRLSDLLAQPAEK